MSALFFFSGVSSLIFETIFARLLTYTFGNTARAVSTVLAAYLGGLALGAFLLGRWVDRHRASLRLYGILELFVGSYCLFIAKLFSLLARVYVSLYHHLPLGAAKLTAVRFGLTFLVILPPTFLMGGTLPVLARYLATQDPDFGPKVDRLYGWNTLGAALGTLVSTYVLMPSMGVVGAIVVACGINLAIFGFVWSLPESQRTSRAAEDQTRPTVSRQQMAAPGELGSRAVLLFGALLTGGVALSYEVLWTHVQAFTLGTTVYAFGVMLFTILCGLGWGAEIVARHLERPALWGQALAASQLLLGLTIFATLPLWNLSPYVFGFGLRRAITTVTLSLALLFGIRICYLANKSRQHTSPGDSSWLRRNEARVEAAMILVLALVCEGVAANLETTLFFAAELVRFFCALFLLTIPALLLGMSFPLLLNLASRTQQRAGTNVGGIYALNTVGAVAGSVLTGFVLLPVFGSRATLRGAAAMNLALGLFFSFSLVPLTRMRKLALLAGVLSVALLFWLGQEPWDARRMSLGSYVWFRSNVIDRVQYMREDIQGGLTSVVQAGPARVLYTNGKFQGNNGDEVPAQSRFALIPTLFASGFDRALVIGLGTGNTLRTLSLFPFRHIDAVEFSPSIVEAARLWFEDVNGRVFDRDPRINLAINDGRNFLLLSRQRYDLITIEITSIWISGEADLYNREFYELARAHLTEQGVLSQWVQLHHMRTETLLVILNTVAHVFPHVAFFIGPSQGLFVASAAPLECDYRQMENFEADPMIRRELRALGLPAMSSLLGELALYGGSLQQALGSLPRQYGRRPDFVSTDYFPYLEYRTPLGNVLPYDTVAPNVAFARGLSSLPLPPELKIRNLPSENERDLMLGYVSAHRGDIARAVQYLERVHGPARELAQAEIRRIASAAGRR